MRIIDFHTHLADRWFETPLMSEETFLLGMDEYGVETACIYTLMGFYGDCGPENDRLAARAAAHPKRFIPFVTVDPKLGAPAIDELERCLSNPIFRGVKFHPWIQACPPSMRPDIMKEILRCAARYDVPVLFHDGTPPNSSTFQIAAMARWAPEAKIVLGHAGLGDYVYAAGQLLRDLPNLYACFSCPKAGELPYLLECAPDRVMFGSDFGAGGGSTSLLGDRLDDVLQSEIGEDDRHRVLYANSARLLHLEERPL